MASAIRSEGERTSTARSGARGTKLSGGAATGGHPLASVRRRDRLALPLLHLDGVLGPPAQVEGAVGGHLVQPLVLRRVWRLLHHFRRLGGLLRDLAQDADEVIE